MKPQRNIKLGGVYVVLDPVKIFGSLKKTIVSDILVLYAGCIGVS